MIIDFFLFLKPVFKQSPVLFYQENRIHCKYFNGENLKQKLSKKVEEGKKKKAISLGSIKQEHKGKWLYSIQELSASGWSLCSKSLLILPTEAEQSVEIWKSAPPASQSALELRRGKESHFSPTVYISCLSLAEQKQKPVIKKLEKCSLWDSLLLPI